MRAFIIEGRDNAYFADVPEKVLQTENDVKVRVESCGICGTDIHIFEGEHKLSIGQKRIPGHEFAGTVVEVGSGVKTLKVGDRVIHEPISYCGNCYACRNGQGNVCQDIKVTGCTCDGGMEEYYVAPERQWHKMPEYMTWEEAALVEPYTIAAQVCDRGEVKTGDLVLIYGAGPIGLMTADVAAHLGATVMITEVSPGRLELAKKFGISHVIDAKEESATQYVERVMGKDRPNVVFDCAGRPEFGEEAFELLSPAGRFVPVAGSDFRFNGWTALIKQIKVAASRLQMKKFQPIIADFECYKEHARWMVTDIFPFSQADKAFEYAAKRNPNTGKIVLRFSK